VSRRRVETIERAEVRGRSRGTRRERGRTRAALALLALATAASLAVAGCDDSSSEGGGGGDAPTTLRTAPQGLDISRPARNTQFLCTPGLTITKPDRPWIEGDTVVIARIPFVEGEVSWQSEFAVTLTPATRRMKGNGLPNHPTGTFPVQQGTGAYDYYAALPAEGYDNAAAIPIEPYDLDITVPRTPQYDAEPHCMTSLVSGVVTQTGAPWHLQIAPDSENNLLDPIAALPMDSCWGHPYQAQYHYHGYSWRCFPNQGEPGEHSPLFGYAIDGFGVYGPRGENGVPVTNDDLDECHGHTHAIEWDGETRVMYHYHVNNEYPYAMGCYRGKPVELPPHLQHGTLHGALPGH
jgi:hypothetical protein